MSDTLPVCFIVDHNLIQQLEPVVKSLVHNVSLKLHICVLTNVESNVPVIQALLTKLVGECHTVSCITEEHVRLLDSVYVAETRSDITSFGYSQLVLPYYFASFPKLLFMEPDQIVQRDLKDLWDSVVSNNIMLSATNYGQGACTLKTLKDLYGGGKAHNCGVMVIDTTNWITKNYTSLCIDAAIKQKELNGSYYNFYAEGAMNVALQPYITEMDRTYNFCNLGWAANISRDAINAATILHWNGKNKPWKPDGLYIEYYAKYV